MMLIWLIAVLLSVVNGCVKVYEEQNVPACPCKPQPQFLFAEIKEEFYAQNTFLNESGYEGEATLFQNISADCSSYTLSCDFKNASEGFLVWRMMVPPDGRWMAANIGLGSVNNFAVDKCDLENGIWTKDGVPASGYYTCVKQKDFIT